MQSKRIKIRTVFRGGLLLILLIGAFGRPINAQTGIDDKEFHQSYPIAANGTVSLTNSSGTIRVTSWDQNSVKVDAIKNGRRSSEFSEVRIQVTATADKVVIRTIYPRERRTGVSVDYNVMVPKSANLDSIISASGDISITGPVLRLTATSASGGIKVEDINEGAIISSASGNIMAHRIGGDLRANTSSGDTDIDGAESRVYAQSSSGSFNVRNVRDDANLSSSSGSIRIEQAGGRINARATSGSVLISDAGGDVQADSISNNITISNVKGRVIATTLSGSINLINIEEGVRARAVSGRIQVRDSKGRIDLNTTSDSIILTDIQSQEVVAKTMSGEVRFTGSLLPGGNYSFESFSGNVIILLPADSGFNLTARTNNERLESEFGFQSDISIPSPRRGTITAVVGNGGSDLRAVTYSGSVYLKKR